MRLSDLLLNNSEMNMVKQQYTQVPKRLCHHIFFFSCKGCFKLYYPHSLLFNFNNNMLTLNIVWILINKQTDFSFRGDSIQLMSTEEKNAKLIKREVGSILVLFSFLFDFNIFYI